MFRLLKGSPHPLTGQRAGRFLTRVTFPQNITGGVVNLSTADTVNTGGRVVLLHSEGGRSQI